MTAARPSTAESLNSVARNRRQTPTVTHALLWQGLRGRRTGGFKFRQEHVLEGVIVPFYCPEAGLAIVLAPEPSVVGRLRRMGVAVVETGEVTPESVGAVLEMIRKRLPGSSGNRQTQPARREQATEPSPVTRPHAAVRRAVEPEPMRATVGPARPLDRFIAAMPVPGRPWRGNLLFPCPVARHRSKRTVSVREKPDQSLLITDFGGCAIEQVVARLGLRVADLYPSHSSKRGSARSMAEGERAAVRPVHRAGCDPEAADAMGSPKEVPPAERVLRALTTGPGTRAELATLARIHPGEIPRVVTQLRTMGHTINYGLDQRYRRDNQ